MSVLFPFENQELWALAQSLAKSVHSCVRMAPPEARPAITDTLLPATDSLISNIALAFSPLHAPDSKIVVKNAYTSAIELLAKTTLFREFDWMEVTAYEEIRQKIKAITDQLTSGVNKQQGYFVHHTAFVAENAFIDSGTRIWHFCHVMGNTVIGKDCSLGQNVFVASKVTIGNNVKIQNNVSVYEGVECEDNVFLGPSMVFTNVYNPRSGVNRKNEYMKTVVKKGATIGANATIVCGNDIGRYAFIGAGAVVTKYVPDYALMVGSPARQIGWMSEFGERLHFDETGHAVCPGNGDNYQLVDGKVHKIES